MHDRGLRWTSEGSPADFGMKVTHLTLTEALEGGMPPLLVGGPSSVINVSPHWRSWLGPKNRCLVPFTSFCEYADTKPRKTPTWFAG